VVARQASDYLAWLCLDRGWYAETTLCTECCGTGRAYDDKPPQRDTEFGGSYTQSRWRRATKRWEAARAGNGKPPYLTDDDKVTCWLCDGSGRKQLPERIYDMGRAEAHIREQRDELERIAATAVDAIKHRLFWHGFRPVVAGSRLAADNLSSHEARELVRDYTVASFDDANQAARERRDAANTAAREPGYDWNAPPREAMMALVREADEEVSRISRAMWALGTTHESRWRRPGCAETIHVGTEGPRRYHDMPKPDQAIVIKPGRAPSGYELDLIAEEAVAAYDGAGADTLPLAA
jgi:hypothetical protein